MKYCYIVNKLQYYQLMTSLLNNVHIFFQNINLDLPLHHFYFLKITHNTRIMLNSSSTKFNSNVIHITEILGGPKNWTVFTFFSTIF